jgi:hypothetical protein
MARAGGGKEQAKLNLRMSEALQAKIDEDARERGLSMNAAIISRVEASFRREEQLKEAMESVLGGARAVAIFQTLAGLAAQAESRTGAPWTEHYWTFQATIRAWRRILPTLAPTMPGEMRRDLDAISHDSWPEVPAGLPIEDLLPTYKPTPEAVLSAYLLGRERPSVQEQDQREGQTIVIARKALEEWIQGVKPLREKLESLTSQFCLFEGIGDQIAKEAMPVLKEAMPARAEKRGS